MKTLVDINEELVKKAMKVTGTSTKKETVQKALEELIKLSLRKRLKDMAGSGILDLSLARLRRRREARIFKHSKIKTFHNG